jgi:hypothetical protein
MMVELIMSHTLELPDELYAALLEAADASGLTPIDWIAVHLLEARGKKGIEGEQMGHTRTLADLFAGRVGRIRSGGKGQLSEECGTKLTDYLEEKRRSGHL